MDNELNTTESKEKKTEPITLIEVKEDVISNMENVKAAKLENEDQAKVEDAEKGQIGGDKSEDKTPISDGPQQNEGITVKGSAAGDEEDDDGTVVTSSNIAAQRSLKWDDTVPNETEEKPAATEEQKVRTNSCKDENGFTYYKCRFCGLTFNYMTTLKAHERVHDITQPYLCNKCGESFHYMCELEYHAKTHLQQKGYKCECGRTFYQYTDLLYHKHPGEDEPLSAAVPVPSASLADFGALTMSSSSAAIHPAEFPTPEFAEQGFEPKYQLKRGLSDVRSKPYICQYCSKSYADSRGLAYHMYSHRGERMFNPRASRYLMCRNDNSYISPGLDLRDA
ncbi:hypothetical protein niasHS_016295 [Heterodera schachtii]|uniref:Zinc finger protein unc-98 n=1 Tax=Heterodera schachtii TaxID=97005 RepID=A0ABD2I4M4_HETSC